MNMKISSEAVKVWSDTGSRTWALETYRDLGHPDLVRVRLDWFAGSGPGRADMVLFKTVSSEPSGAGAGKMVDRTHVPDSGIADEVDSDENPIYLGESLAAEARNSGTIYVLRNI